MYKGLETGYLTDEVKMYASMNKRLCDLESKVVELEKCNRRLLETSATVIEIREIPLPIAKKTGQISSLDSNTEGGDLVSFRGSLGESTHKEIPLYLRFLDTEESSPLTLNKRLSGYLSTSYSKLKSLIRPKATSGCQESYQNASELLLESDLGTVLVPIASSIQES